MHKVGEVPRIMCNGLQVGQQEHGDQGSPYLDFHGVASGTHEALYVEVLLEVAEEDLDVPAGLVKLCDGACRQFEVVCQQGYHRVAFRVVDSDAADSLAVLLPRSAAGEFYHFVFQHLLMAHHRQLTLLNGAV